jgi:predicted Zn-dependent protease with MMP-like domain
MPVRRRGSQARRHPDRRSVEVVGPLPGRGEESLDPFERLVEAAIDGLPGPLRQLLERVAIVIADEPTGEQRRAQRLAPEDTLYGLYEGTPLVAWGADEVPFPNKITLFRVPLEVDFPRPRELAAEVRRTLQHELAHHVGFEERALDRLGLD